MNEDARIALLQEILAGLIERGLIAPLPEQATAHAPLRLTVLPAAAGSTTIRRSPKPRR
jgi:hypothetical protein